VDVFNLIKQNVESLVEEEQNIIAVFLLGSAVRGSLRSDSDIDLGILLEPGSKMSSLKRLEHAGKLSYKLKRTVDMGEISSKNLVYAREALLKGKLLYQRSSGKVNLIRANLLGMYIQYNIDRRLLMPMSPDNVVLNKAAIDMAQHLVAVNHSGMPQTSADAFLLLEKDIHKNYILFEYLRGTIHGFIRINW